MEQTFQNIHVDQKSINWKTSNLPPEEIRVLQEDITQATLVKGSVNINTGYEDSVTYHWNSHLTVYGKFQISDSHSSIHHLPEDKLEIHGDCILENITLNKLPAVMIVAGDLYMSRCKLGCHFDQLEVSGDIYLRKAGAVALLPQVSVGGRIHLLDDSTFLLCSSLSDIDSDVMDDSRMESRFCTIRSEYFNEEIHDFLKKLVIELDLNTFVQSTLYEQAAPFLRALESPAVAFINSVLQQDNKPPEHILEIRKKSVSKIPMTYIGHKFSDEHRMRPAYDGHVYIANAPDWKFWTKAGVSITGDLHIRNCKNLQNLPEDLSIGGSLFIRNCDSLTELPERLRVANHVHVERCPRFRKICSRLHANTLLLSECGEKLSSTYDLSKTIIEYNASPEIEHHYPRTQPQDAVSETKMMLQLTKDDENGSEQLLQTVKKLSADEIASIAFDLVDPFEKRAFMKCLKQKQQIVL